MINNANIKEFKKFGQVVGGIFLFLALFFFWREGEWGPRSSIFGTIGIFLVAGGFLFPRALGPLYRAWMALGHVLGKIMSTVILTVFFYTIFTVFALVLRLFGKKFLDVRPDSQAQSYWRKRAERVPSRESFEQQF